MSRKINGLRLVLSIVGESVARGRAMTHRSRSA
jgi:hypothetical protein